MTESVDKKWYILWSLELAKGSSVVMNNISKSEAVLWEPQVLENDGVKKEYVSMFSSYFFIFGTLQQVLAIEENCKKDLCYCTRFLRYDPTDPPGTVSNEEIERLKNLEREEKIVLGDLVTGDYVCIKEGPFENFKGTVIDVKKDQVQIQLPVLGRSVDLWIKFTNCTKVGGGL